MTLALAQIRTLLVLVGVAGAAFAAYTAWQRHDARTEERARANRHTHSTVERIEDVHEQIEMGNARGGDSAVIDRLREGSFLRADPGGE